MKLTSVTQSNLVFFLIQKENLYWLIISDLVNLLSHKAVAMVLLQNENLVEIWFELISYFQVMNLNVRKFGEHVQQEQPTYFSSFSAELEFCSSVLWSFLQHLKGNQNANLSKKLINLLMINLRKWLTSIDLVSSYSLIKRPNSKHLTFHLPLHRYFSAFIYNAIYEQSCDLNYLLGVNECSSHFLADILAYPLQLQIGFHEIHANMWVRNGMQMKGQAMTYVQNHLYAVFFTLFVY
jgi:E3 ubiquitin-protein ligase UBR3